MRLKSLEILNNENRIKSLDFYRGLAILLVVFYHFNESIKYGYIGVDLFFVISGFLVGGIVIKEYRKGKLKYWNFLLKRGFKIWPSYYFFIIAGNVIAYFTYRNTRPENYIPLDDYPRYILFYRNFTGTPNHWSFDHIWSICIEEHFYILFPLTVIVLSIFTKIKNKHLFSILGLMIVLGFASKIIMYNYTNGQDTYSATNNRIDALAYGILLFLINPLISNYSIWRKVSTYAGLALIILLILLNESLESIIYNKIIFHSLLPLGISLLIFGTYHFKFKKIKIIGFLAYYSYNWYLWHPLFYFFIIDTFEKNIFSLFLYLIISFTLAVLTTILIEEFFLKLRTKIFS
jgi:peptidoglycan/LPS O-acetylase OafA/YrhL